MYRLLINDTPTKVHASNMKPYSGRKNVLTQYTDPGLERDEAAEGIAKEPLLMSPSSGLNQMARVRYQLRNSSIQKAITERERTAQTRAQREVETQRLSQSQSDIWVMEDAPQEVTGSSSSQLNSSALSQSVAGSAQREEETNMLFIDESGPSSQSSGELESVNVRDQKRVVGASWIASVKKSITAKKTTRTRILAAAGITPEELEKDLERKTRIDSWIREISAEENQRRSKAARSPSTNKSSLMASPAEVVGRRVKEKEVLWSAIPFNNNQLNEQLKLKGKRRKKDGNNPKMIYQSPKAGLNDKSGDKTNLSKRKGKPEDRTAKANTLKFSSGKERLQEEVNCLTIDEWDSSTLSSDTEEAMQTDNIVMTNHLYADAIFDRNHWHRLLLKLGSRVVLTENPNLCDPEAYTRWDIQPVSKLKVELDTEIPIPLGMRKVWYCLLDEIRKFRHKGLLIPTTNNGISHSERWRNRTLDTVKIVSGRVYDYIQDVVEKSKAYHSGDKRYQLSYFFPRLKGRVTIMYYPTVPRRLPVVEIEKAIRRKYDTWYWTSLRQAEKIEPDRRKGANSQIRIRYQHHPKEWRRMWDIPREEYRTTLFYMKDAIDRNGELSHSPRNVGEVLCC